MSHPPNVKLNIVLLTKWATLSRERRHYLWETHLNLQTRGHLGFIKKYVDRPQVHEKKLMRLKQTLPNDPNYPRYAQSVESIVYYLPMVFVDSIIEIIDCQHYKRKLDDAIDNAANQEPDRKKTKLNLNSTAVFDKITALFETIHDLKKEKERITEQRDYYKKQRDYYKEGTVLHKTNMNYWKSKFMNFSSMLKNTNNINNSANRGNTKSNNNNKKEKESELPDSTQQTPPNNKSPEPQTKCHTNCDVKTNADPTLECDIKNITNHFLEMGFDKNSIHKALQLHIKSENDTQSLVDKVLTSLLTATSVEFVDSFYFSANCHICKQHFDAFCEYKDDIKKHYDESPGKEWRKCDVGCNNHVSQNDSNFLAHIASHLRQKAYHCKLCTATHRTKGALKQHWKCAHTSTSKQKVKINKVNSSQHPRKFQSNKERNKHTRLVNDNYMPGARKQTKEYMQAMLQVTDKRTADAEN